MCKNREDILKYVYFFILIGGPLFGKERYKKQEKK